MTATDALAGNGNLDSVVEHAHAQAQRALDDPQGPQLQAVTWLSSHLAAVQQVLVPAARRHGRSELAATLRRHDRRLHQSLWLLDRRLTGDAHASHVSLEHVVVRLRRDVAAHTEAERALLDVLQADLGDADRRNLAARLQAATASAPTRPHPSTPQVTGTRRLVFRLEGLIDRIRDVLDNRHPTRPQREPRPAGLWGMYLLGTPAARPAADDQQMRGSGSPTSMSMRR
jgi:hypothetical protein